MHLVGVTTIHFLSLPKHKVWIISKKSFEKHIILLCDLTDELERGDRNQICLCAPMKIFETAKVVDSATSLNNIQMEMIVSDVELTHTFPRDHLLDFWSRVPDGM